MSEQNKKKKKISEIPQHPMDCYEVANAMYELMPGDRGYNSTILAAEAADEMKAAGWRFKTYNEFGQEVWEPPKAEDKQNET